MLILVPTIVLFSWTPPIYDSLREDGVQYSKPGNLIHLFPGIHPGSAVLVQRGSKGMEYAGTGFAPVLWTPGTPVLGQTGSLSLDSFTVEGNTYALFPMTLQNLSDLFTGLKLVK